MKPSIAQQKEFIYGVHPVLEVLRCGKREIYKIMVSLSRERKGIEDIIVLCQNKKIRVTELPGKKITDILKSPHHQGVVAEVSTPHYSDQRELISKLKTMNNGLFMLLDRIQDAGNFGGILRSAAAFGVDGILIPAEKSAKLTPGALKASAGVAERIPITTVKDTSSVLEFFSKANYKLIALEAHQGESIFHMDLRRPLVCVMGGEDQGVRQKIKDRCDAVATIPISGTVNSISVAAAAAVILSEISRQNSKDMK
jgi:23S rRNA (guanosine2251-2'-O)-methyltransferase